MDRVRRAIRVCSKEFTFDPRPLSPDNLGRIAFHTYPVRLEILTADVMAILTLKTR